MISNKEINRLAFPAMVSGIIEPIISLVDTAFVGKLGATELAAVGLASSFYLLLVWMLGQTKGAVTANVSSYYGKGNLDAIKGLVPIALWLNIAIGLIVFIALFSFKESVFQLYGATGALNIKASEYFGIRSIGFPITFGTLIMLGAFRGLQNTSWPMYTSLVGGSVNLVLDPLLIYGAPDILAPMGIAGAAWASVIAQSAMFGMALFILLRKTPFRFIPRSLIHPETKRLLLLSSDLFIRTLAMNLAYYLGNRQATLLGDAQIATHTIIMNIWLFSSYFIDGYAEAGMVLSGRLKGERKWPELRNMVFRITKLSVFVGGIIALAYWAGYNYIGNFFSSNTEVLLLFTSVFWIAILCQPLNGIAFAMDGVFNGLGEGALMRNTLLASTLLVFVPFMYYSSINNLGLKGIWLAFLLWMLARGIPLLVAFNSRNEF